MTPKRKAKEVSLYAAPYWRRNAAWKTVSHIIQCWMQFVPNGRVVTVDGRNSWTITNKELRDWERAANNAAKHVVRELRRRKASK